MAIDVDPALPLLKLRPELGEGLGRERTAARAVTVETHLLAAGPWTPPEDLLGDREVLGLLVADGLLVRDLLLGTIVATELLADGDLAVLTPSPDALLPLEVRWTVAVPTRVAVLDRRLLGTLERWPTIAQRLLSSTLAQHRRQAAHRALSQRGTVVRTCVGPPRARITSPRARSYRPSVGAPAQGPPPPPFRPEP